MSALNPDEKPTLLHRRLHDIPQTVRFGITGLLNNVLFLTFFNEAVHQMEHLYAASTIYSIIYCIFIPIGHAITSLTVFGWPKPYLPSLLSNAPIGITAMCIGTFCTAYLDKISFHQKFESFLHNNFASIMGPLPGNDGDDEEGEFYSSLAVSIITGIWSFVLSMLVNSSTPSKNNKRKGSKEL
uniref:Uncharacterized protein n=1 Tax=Eucampia antarctica TaxID=49252 RepID=A0A7S2RNZ6_9STRA|mmetsp:Transcript_24767/g.23796  ORF Transcript_24767/g.23796 Transcript_24767/m.23796 type:complete len:184 (+) Transcript_24767:135-686(+)|eukprot:CAMPEP_0197827028 /NCGR_PEP_ID=MMETSP1437-20131217/3905_1 /TAXON_ID=49252 ORGANISM="Eucampia antarctica, Strain CCMP1452" /NCGR_SAMPLE_ID=MMETSP1437 /ASSEMBLY_ACC=CAM_ASM_001096 /LENGTH=183 /DNA_ID=CAMNT_0043427729 /DNA_START=115 /DNA_END=666 /DNA_ORIENTATION=+